MFLLKDKVMEKIVIGIDVSKNKLDFCVLGSDGILKEVRIDNKLSSIRKLLVSLQLAYPSSGYDLLLCAEYTGHYTYPLSCVSEELALCLWLENPMQIKYRSGMNRGKNDKMDARKIAYYAMRFADAARVYHLPDKIVQSLSLLISERDLYLSDRSKYQGQLTDQKSFMSPQDYQDKRKRLCTLIQELTIAIGQIEQKIHRIISEDPELSRQHQLLCSIEGIGERIAVKMIVETNAFREFKQARKFCCHAGVVPFTYCSGSSIRSANRVSQRADKSIKTLLHMAALVAATRMKWELNEYYLRKVRQGKNKMAALNAVRAKLVHRMFAVIKRNTPYEKIYQNKFA